jgi:ABC-type sugar transport system substrate-binding protein
VFPGFQETPVLLFTADGDTLPQFRPGIQQLRDHMSDLNEQIVVFHGLTITAEEMLQIETMILLGVEALIFNGPSSPAINQ